MPGKARPPQPGPGQAKKAAVRKRAGGLYAVPDAAPSAEAAPSAKATMAGRPDKATVRKRPGREDAVPVSGLSADATMQDAPDRPTAAESLGREAAMPGLTAPGVTDPAAAGERPSSGGATPPWVVPIVADLATPGERPGGDEAVPDWAMPDETMAPDDMDMAGAGLWLSVEEAARERPAAREWFGGEEAARAACLKLLTSAPRTRAQLAAALRRRRVPDEIAESVLARFTEVGLIDDAAFARAWVESRHHSRGLARRALAAELRQRGVADGEVRAAVGSLGTQDEVAAAQRLVAKRIAATRGRPIPVRVRQLLAMLARKGYSVGLAARVVREALEQEEPDNPDDRLDLARFCEDSATGDWL